MLAYIFSYPISFKFISIHMKYEPFMYCQGVLLYCIK